VDYYVPSVALAMQILTMLSRYKHKSCSLKDISDLTGTNKTTCLRVLRTLERENFVRYDAETKKYSLGQYLIPLGNRAIQLNDSVALAASELKSVARETGMTTVLIERLHDHRVIYIASEEPLEEEVKISVSIGQKFPISGPGFGHCFLAYDDGEKWQELIEAGLVKYTANSIVDAKGFIEKLEQIRESGYSVSHGSLLPGISGVAAPIFGKSKKVEFVMACLAMTTQFETRPEIEERVIQILLDSTRKLSVWNGMDTRLKNLR
jgi:DNA-binding IclR family transcriptional regulator